MNDPTLLMDYKVNCRPDARGHDRLSTAKDDVVEDINDQQQCDQRMHFPILSL